VAIVIVDDSPTNLIVLRGLCTKERWPTLVFASPVDAITHLSQTYADVVVVDWDMPDVNGVDLITRIRAHPNHRRTPIVMVTSTRSAAIKRSAIEAGATMFLNKPVGTTDFKLCIRDLIASRGGYSAPPAMAIGR
jgi:putative two-component system response regulator